MTRLDDTKAVLADAARFSSQRPGIMVRTDDMLARKSPGEELGIRPSNFVGGLKHLPVHLTPR